MLNSAGQLTPLASLVITVLQGAKAPLAYLLDENWICRGITDFAMDEVSVLWIFPEVYAAPAHQLRKRWTNSSNTQIGQVGS